MSRMLSKLDDEVPQIVRPSLPRRALNLVAGNVIGAFWIVSLALTARFAGSRAAAR